MAQKGNKIAGIIKTMLEFTDNSNTQEHCCSILSNFARHEENQISISHEGGIEAVLGAMNNHIHHINVQKEACIALRCLAYHNAEN